jgi:LPPG:FO 2-phospho-L-lactate transferase
MRLVALAGGVGASKLLLGLYHVMTPRDLTVVVNTGDDIELHGLSISPDLDIVTYTLAGVVNPETGWGIRGDTFHLLRALERYGREGWFNLGDADLATHIHRTALLRSGKTLSQVTDSIRQALHVEARILPMSDQPVRTTIVSDRGVQHFQEYLVKDRAEPVVKEIVFEGIAEARPAPGVLESLAEADAIVICPSNPLISIGPILAVPGVRPALEARAAKVVAVCPIVGGRSLKGPSDRMLAQLRMEVSARAVARLYAGLAATYVIDSEDEWQKPEIEGLGMKVAVTSTVMRTDEDKVRLARQIVEWAAAL